MLRRALIVAAAYALSFAGFFFMILGAFAVVRNEPGLLARLIPLIWLFAWVAHVHMSIAWIRDRPVSMQWPVWGTVAGVAGLGSPLFTLLGDYPGSFGHRVESALTAIGFLCAFFLPAILLAIYLVRFQASRNFSRSGSPG